MFPSLHPLISGFVAALQLSTPPERVEAIRALVDKGFRLGAAIDQPSSDAKPVDITLAALDLAAQVVGNKQINERNVL